MDDVKRLLVAIDGSRGSLKAVRMAAMIARRFQAEVTLINVIEIVETPSLIGETENEKAEARAREILSDALEIAVSEGIQAKSVLIKGHAAAKIIQFEAEYGPQMTFVGTRGMGRGTSLLIGSVSKAVVQGCKGSVLVVR